jgi:glycine cleavage system H lipoate-binding protein/ABC-type phosphate transport system substrate-binding protein/cbb3-type cytochrome oxidase subunit 3
MSSPDLNSLTSNWITEYCNLNPTVKFTRCNFPDGKIQAKIDLTFISSEYYDRAKDETTWKMVIGHDATVAIINTNNPMFDEICQQGISADKMATLFADIEKRNWDYVITNGQNVPIHLYITSNEAVTSSLAVFVKTTTTTISGILLPTVDELVSAVQMDLYAIGFCKLTDVRNDATNELSNNITLLPIDKNRNGRIDKFENIYGNLDAFERGVWIGKYPNALCGNIYAVSSTHPTNKNTLAFLTWVLSDGQQFLNQNGYCDLVSIERKSNIAILTGVNSPADQSDKPFFSQAWPLILLALIFIGSIAIGIVKFIRNKKQATQNENISITPLLDEISIAAPKGLYFGKTHTWAFMEKDGNVKVGIDDFLQHITGILTRIKMKDPGEKVRKGEKILTIIRDGKQLNIYSPISGIIKEQNQTLIKDSSIINASPYSEGWVYLIEPKNWVRETQFLYMSEKYKEWLKGEFSRLKDFFAASVRSNTSAYAHIILQDGGELTDNVLADLEPEVWEDFQTSFIDSSR